MLVAVGHAILTIAFKLLQDKTTYQELVANYFDERDKQAVEKRLVKRLEKLGDAVSLALAAQTA